VWQLADGGFVLANTVQVYVPDETIYHVSILRADESGDPLWYRIFDIDDCHDRATRVTETADGDIAFLASGHLRDRGDSARRKSAGLPR
jgi:hypothetical protein